MNASTTSACTVGEFRRVAILNFCAVALNVLMG